MYNQEVDKHLNGRNQLRQVLGFYNITRISFKVRPLIFKEYNSGDWQLHLMTI